MKIIVVGPDSEIPSFRRGDDADAVVCRMEHHMGGVYRLNVVRKQPLGFDSYLISARNKKALFWPGAKHPVKSVMHTRASDTGKSTVGRAVSAYLTASPRLKIKDGVMYDDGGEIIGEEPLEDPNPFLDPANYLGGVAEFGLKTGLEIETTYFEEGNIFKIISRRLKTGFRIDPAHHEKP